MDNVIPFYKPKFTAKEKRIVLVLYNDDSQMFLLQASSRDFLVMAEINREDAAKPGVSAEDKAAYLQHAETMELLAENKKEQAYA